MRRVLKTNSLILSVLLLAGCSSSVRKLHPISADVSASQENPRPDQLVVKYLGCGGYLLRRGEDSLLMAPFFSNPPILKVGLAHIQANEDTVEQHLGELGGAKQMLVGHAHYDHLLDVPLITRLAGGMTIYGSPTAYNILHKKVGNAELVKIRDASGARVQAGEWYRPPDQHFRFMPIKSEHAPHFAGIKLYGGEVADPCESLPKRACGWKEGQTYAFLIDFLDEDGSVSYRIHYQDAASNPPLGFPPLSAFSDGKGVDLAITCAACFREVDCYPEAVIGLLEPRFIIAGHWENFFRPWSKDPKELRVVPLTNLRKFLAKARRAAPSGSKVLLLCPGATTVLSPARWVR